MCVYCNVNRQIDISLLNLEMKAVFGPKRKRAHALLALVTTPDCTIFEQTRWVHTQKRSVGNLDGIRLLSSTSSNIIGYMQGP